MVLQGLRNVAVKMQWILSSRKPWTAKNGILTTKQSNKVGLQPILNWLKICMVFKNIYKKNYNSFSYSNIIGEHLWSKRVHCRCMLIGFCTSDQSTKAIFDLWNGQFEATQIGFLPQNFYKCSETHLSGFLPSTKRPEFLYGAWSRYFKASLLY